MYFPPYYWLILQLNTSNQNETLLYGISFHAYGILNKFRYLNETMIFNLVNALFSLSAIIFNLSGNITCNPIKPMESDKGATGQTYQKKSGDKRI